MPHTIEVIQERLSNGYSYYGSKDRMAYIRVIDSDEIHLTLYTRDPKGIVKQWTETGAVNEFNRLLVEDDPIGGLTTTRYGLVHTSVIPRRHNRFNFANENVTFQNLSHGEAAYRFDMVDAFLPRYLPLATLIEELEDGARLGGALTQFYGVSVTTSEFPMLFFNTFPCGFVNPAKWEVTVFRSGWSYFEEVKNLFEPMFTCKRE